MKRLNWFVMLTAIGFLWNGCRENGVSPLPIGAGGPPMADTLGKLGIVGGDTLSSLRNAEPVLPTPTRSTDAAIRKKILEEETEGKNIH